MVQIIRTDSGLLKSFCVFPVWLSSLCVSDSDLHIIKLGIFLDLDFSDIKYGIIFRCPMWFPYLDINRHCFNKVYYS